MIKKKMIINQIVFNLILISIFFLSLGYSIDLRWCYPKKFIVSGYYSPKWWQRFYYRWSRWLEIKLNWKGIRWASWKLVFNWMIAAPSKYKFWTKIYFPWYWVWQVEDRGGAIVSAWVRGNKYDRIDIWMGWWEDWLRRALSFWKKVLVGYVCPANKKLKVWFDRDRFPIYKDNFFDVTLWWVSLWKWRKDPWVRSLQKYLVILWFFPKNLITWYFWPLTKRSLCNFQLKYWIVKSRKDAACWYFWPKTRDFMKKLLISKWILKKDFYKSYVIPYKIKQARQKKITFLKLTFNRWFIIGEKGEKIKILQTYLKKLWYYSGPINWIYNTSTANAVYKFQLDYGIVSGKEDPKILGYFWPKTRAVFIKVVKEKLLNS